MWKWWICCRCSTSLSRYLIRLNPKKNEGLFQCILALDSSTLTACGNDIGFNYIFFQKFRGFRSKKDLLIAISTSGNSKNILEVLKSKKQGIYSISFLGAGGGDAKKHSSLNLIVPHNNVARIQECHILLDTCCK